MLSKYDIHIVDMHRDIDDLVWDTYSLLQPNDEGKYYFKNVEYNTLPNINQCSIDVQQRQIQPAPSSPSTPMRELDEANENERYCNGLPKK